jgi:teichuronic acid biosynthesis glycosyltransferase TuaC
MRVLVISPAKAPFVEDPLRFLPQEFEVDLLYISASLSHDPPRRSDSVRIEEMTGLPALTNRYLIKKVQAELNSLLIDRRVGEYDIVHGHFTYPSGRFLSRLKASRGVGTVLTGHGSDVYLWPFLNGRWNREIRTVLGDADRVITVSRRNCDILLENDLVAEERLRLIYNGVDDTRFRPMASGGGDGTRLLAVGRFSTEKRHLDLIRAMDGLEATLTIVGKGGMKAEYERLIASLGLEDRITLIDWLEPDELAKVINSADVFVHPSEREGFPAILPEVLACGVPVVATAVGGVPEIIDASNGILVRDMLQSSLVEGIREAMRTNFDTKAIAEGAKRRFSYSQVSAQLADVYREAGE